MHWIHEKCSRIASSLSKAKDFNCFRCSRSTKNTEQTTDQTPATLTLKGSSLEMVNKFCYLGDTIDATCGDEDSTITRVQCGWKKFQELLHLLGASVVSLKVKGTLHKTCVQTALLHTSESWAVKADDTQGLDRAEKAMICWMCTPALKDSHTSDKLKVRL